jgi:hypothetical protein
VFEVIRWISLAMMWLCIVVNACLMVYYIRLNKQLKLEHKLCTTLMNASMEFIDAHIEKSKMSKENNNETDAH